MRLVAFNVQIRHNGTVADVAGVCDAWRQRVSVFVHVVNHVLRGVGAHAVRHDKIHVFFDRKRRAHLRGVVVFAAFFDSFDVVFAVGIKLDVLRMERELGVVRQVFNENFLTAVDAAMVAGVNTDGIRIVLGLDWHAGCLHAKREGERHGEPFAFFIHAVFLLVFFDSNKREAKQDGAAQRTDQQPRQPACPCRRVWTFGCLSGQDGRRWFSLRDLILRGDVFFHREFHLQIGQRRLIAVALRFAVENDLEGNGACLPLF